MVFSSVPVYLDPPNWQQQHPINHDHHQHQHQESGGRSSITDHHHHNQNPNLPPLQNQQELPPPPGGSIKPGSMAERARQAKIPQPETALKCPRCDSANTKFCYFNNYSLTQPRHFCKTCRRYWTRGGALRSVPVGGGCRRNKRTKGSSKSKPSGSSTAAAAPNNPDVHQAGVACSNTTSNSGDMFGHLPPPPLPQHFPFLPNLHHLSSENYYGTGSGEIGMNNFAGIPMPTQGSSGDVEFLSTGLAEQWRLQQQVHHQFPFLGNLDQTQTGSILYPNLDTQSEPQSYIRSSHHKAMDSSAVTSGLVSQMSAVKFEGNSSNGDDNNNNNNQGVNLSRNFLGILGNNTSLDPHHNYSNAWTDVSSFSTSSTSHNII